MNSGKSKGKNSRSNEEPGNAMEKEKIRKKVRTTRVNKLVTVVLKKTTFRMPMKLISGTTVRS